MQPCRNIGGRHVCMSLTAKSKSCVAFVKNQILPLLSCIFSVFLAPSAARRVTTQVGNFFLKLSVFLFLFWITYYQYALRRRIQRNYNLFHYKLFGQQTFKNQSSKRRHNNYYTYFYMFNDLVAIVTKIQLMKSVQSFIPLVKFHIVNSSQSKRLNKKRTVLLADILQFKNKSLILKR